MKKYRIKEVYRETGFGHKLTKYVIQIRRCYFFWCDVGKPYDSYRAAANQIDILREVALFEDD